MKKIMILLNKKHFVIIALFLLYVFPLLFSPYYYMDDNVRVVTGKPDWGWQGRPFADWLYYSLSFSTSHIKDLFPYSLIAGLFLLSLYYKKTNLFIIGRNKEKIFYILPFLFIIINPFFIQNLSYRYDSLPMLLALISGMSAYFVLDTSLNKIVKVIISISLLITSLSLYQPCVNAYLILMFYSMILLNFQNFKDYLKVVLKQIVVFIIGVLSYNILVLKILGYGTPRSTLIGFSDITLIFNKIAFFFNNLLFQLPVMISCLFCCLFLCSFYCIIKMATNKIIAIISLCGMFLSLWGGLLLIKENVDLPREFPVFGLYCCCLFSFLLSVPPYRKVFILLTTLLLCLNTLYFNQYVILYQQQKSYEGMIENEIVKTVKKDAYLLNSDINVIGKPSYSPEVGLQMDRDLFLRRIINTPDEWISRYSLYKKGLHNMDLDFASDSKKTKEKICFYNMVPYKETSLYDIYIINGKAEIFLKRTPILCHK